jgi:hypothetical protein
MKIFEPGLVWPKKTETPESIKWQPRDLSAASINEFLKTLEKKEQENG